MHLHFLSPKIFLTVVVDCKVLFAAVRGDKIWVVISLNQCQNQKTKIKSVYFPVKIGKKQRDDEAFTIISSFPSVVLLPCPSRTQLKSMLRLFCCTHTGPLFKLRII